MKILTVSLETFGPILDDLTAIFVFNGIPTKQEFKDAITARIESYDLDEEQTASEIEQLHAVVDKAWIANDETLLSDEGFSLQLMDRDVDLPYMGDDLIASVNAKYQDILTVTKAF
jgi:hypothetical protein